MDSVPTEFDLSMTLRKRLEEINDQKESNQKKVNQANEQLQRLLAKSSKKFRETPEQLENEIKELERKRTTTSLPLAKEKEILRHINSIKKNIVQAKEYADKEVLIKEKKAELSNLRTNLRGSIAQIAELEKALSKIELAGRLGCDTKDLTSHIVDCPGNKLGQVIGKNGSNIKQLEKKTGCLIDVDKVKSQIHLNGSVEAIHEAIEELENITLAVEESMVLSEAVHSHLFGKRMAALTKLQNFHPKVYFDLSRDSKTLKIRGKPEAVTEAKETVSGIDVQMEVISLGPRETGLIVGKGGVTVNQLVEEFNVAIDVSKKNDEASEAKIVGTSDNVEQAKAKIQSIVFNNEEVEKSIIVDQLTRNKLLTNGGDLIKKMQKEVNEKCDHNNTYITFEKLSKEDAKSSNTSILIIKAPRMGIDQSTELVKTLIEAYESDITVMKVDLDIVPVIIGKGGVKINELRKLGKGAEVNVDKLSGEIKILADDEATRNSVQKAIAEIVDENQVINVTVEESMLGLVFGQQGKELRKKINDEGGSIDNGGTASRSTVAIRGRIEKITEAAQLLRDYIDDNFTIEFKYDFEDEEALVGSKSILNRLQTEYGIKATMMKSRGNVLLRGKQKAVEESEKELKTFLAGGDGFAVFKVVVPENAIGPIIGKGGANIKKIRSNHEGVNISINRSSLCICIRGSEDIADSCRGDIIRAVASSNITDSVSISPEQYEKLSAAGAISKLMSGIPVETNLSASSISMRGRCKDVSDAKAQIEEVITGVYKGVIVIDPSLWKKICASSENFDAINEKTDAEVKINAKAKTIEVTGKRSNVKKAKLQVFSILENILQSQFTKVKMVKPLVKSVGDSLALADISVKTGCNVSLDRDHSSILVQSPLPQSISKAVELVEQRIKNNEKLIQTITFPPVDIWIYPKLFSKKEEVESESRCRVQIMKAENMVCLIGKEEDQVKKARTLMDAVIEQAHKENVFFDLPESSVNIFVGTSGKSMKQFGGKNRVTIERVKRNPTRFRVQGSEGNVKSALSAVSGWIEKWEVKNEGINIEIDDSVVSAIQGSDRSAMKEIEKECGVKVDINHAKSHLVVRSGKNANTKAAVEKVNSFIIMQKNKSQRQNIDVPQDAKLSKPEEPEPEEKILKAKPLQPLQETVVKVTNVTAKKVQARKPAPTILRETKQEKPKKSTIESNSGADHLFNLLISGGSSPSGIVTADESQDQWDSSTVSSETESIGMTDAPATNGYIKSASGFTVRL